MKHRVYLVEDHAVVRAAMTTFLQTDPDLEVCGAAGAAAPALAEIPAVAPDIALVDLSLPDGSGLDLIRKLQTAAPGVRTLVVSGHDKAVYGQQAIEAGALGFVPKGNPAALLAAVWHVLNEGAGESAASLR